MTRRVLYLVRHGETDWNAVGRWQGHTDVPLNARGVAQSRDVARRLRQASVFGVVTSDLVRARETARIVAEELGIKVDAVDPELRERAFGTFEGLTREECERLHPGPFRAWLLEKRAPPGGEERPDVSARMVRAVERAATRAGPPEAPLLLVTHGGALRALLSTLRVNAAPVPNGAIWRLDWKGAVARAVPHEDPC